MMSMHRAIVAVGDQNLLPIEAAEPASELEEFVYIVSHDLRNSARALTEVPQWLRADLEAQGVVPGADMSEDFELLERHAERLDRMLLDLLAYSRVGRLQEISNVSMRNLISRVVEETAHSDRIKVHYDTEMPSVVMGYKDGFVLVKAMVDNVIRHCPPEGHDLWISAQRDGDNLNIDFRDNGPGVETCDLKRIFKPMTTLRRRDEVEGSGMGLAIVHKIARHYNGGVAAGKDPETGGLHVKVTLNDAKLMPYERVELTGIGRNG